MIGVTSACTAGAVGCELVNTWNSTGKMASERREIHCKPSIKYLKNCKKIKFDLITCINKFYRIQIIKLITEIHM